ncbi:hypothetical protein TELCIR_11691 [Teladorsagia circumcincta]|uniref:Uncharacterized protein n=1 Tax=Teladorsagia circumcincta TaxID=45464 RepID=A0A2G9U8K9_TELCI|nr:hypothetical protein TELCIR_11691 [Teladorsagia circumcincta]
MDILGTLLPSCSKDTLEKNYSLAPLLLHRLRRSEDMDSLNEISGCILSLYKLGSHGQENYLHDTADVLSSYCVNNSQDFPFTCMLQRLTECIANLRFSCDNYGLFELPSSLLAAIDFEDRVSACVYIERLKKFIRYSSPPYLLRFVE